MSFIQTVTVGGAPPTPLTSAAFASSTTTGNTIIVAIADNSFTATEITSVTDSKSNTYAQITVTSTGTATVLSVYAAYNITGGSGHTITVNATGTATTYGVVAQEFSSIATTGAVDVSALGNTGTGTAADSLATATTTQADETVIGIVAFTGLSSTPTLGTGFTNKGNIARSNVNCAIESQIVTTTGTQDATWTLSASRTWVCNCIAFKAPLPPSAAPRSSIVTQALRRSTLY